MPRQRTSTPKKVVRKQGVLKRNQKRVKILPKIVNDDKETVTVSGGNVQVTQTTVEVHWIPASAGSVIQIPCGRAAQIIRICDDGRIVPDVDSKKVRKTFPVM